MKDKVIKYIKENYLLLVALLIAICGCVLCCVFGYRSNYYERLEYTAQLEQNGFYDESITILQNYDQIKTASTFCGLGVGLIFLSLCIVVDWCFTYFFKHKGEKKDA